MKKFLFFFCIINCSLQLQAQPALDGKWTYTIYPANIVKLSWQGNQMQHTEQVSDAVIANALSTPKTLPGITTTVVASKLPNISFRTDRNSVTVSIGKLLVHFLNGFDSGHHRGVDILLKPKENLYGAGERTIPMNRIGQRIPLSNNPWYGYAENADALNFSVPVLMSTEGYGLLFDNPSVGYFDIGKTRAGILEAGFESGAIDVYIIPGKNLDETLQHYAVLTGKQPLPPRWALGNFVSRFGYQSQQQATEVIHQMTSDHFPMDAVVIDLFWFGDSIKGTLGNLDWNRSKWPSPEKMISDFRKQNINTILVTEPFILKGTKNYNNSIPYLATTKDGDPYELQDFYFGKGGLVDLFQPASKNWFWQFYKKQIDIGVGGWWGDLGEPEKHPADMYHNLSSAGSSRLMSANEVHGLYGNEWSKMLFQQYATNYPTQRLFFLNRAGFAGSQRYSIFPWTGDVSRSWSGLRAQLPNLQSMSMSGIPYTHSDAGGFAGGDIDPELYTRWLQFACFTPVFRPHGTALGDIEPGVKNIPSEPCFQQEPYKTYVRNVIKTRYRLLPYNYSLAFEQTSKGKPLIRPMFYYSTADTNLQHATDEYMWGDAFLVAPVLQPGAKERRLYLPAGVWYNFNNNQVVQGGRWVNEKTTIENIPVFVKAGSFVPVWENDTASSTASYSSNKRVDIVYYPSPIKTNYTFYDDDGTNKNTLQEHAYQQLEFTGLTKENEVMISITPANWPIGFKRKFIVQIADSKITKLNINNTLIYMQTTGNLPFTEFEFDGKNVKQD